jgi:hypothetical protein
MDRQLMRRATVHELAQIRGIGGLQIAVWLPAVLSAIASAKAEGPAKVEASAKEGGFLKSSPPNPPDPSFPFNFVLNRARRFPTFCL